MAYNDGGGSSGDRCPGPGLIAPADGATLPSNSATFQWNAVSGCTFNGYTLRVKTTTDMDDLSSGVVIDTGVDGSQHTTAITGRDNVDLYWAVRAANAANGADWSQIRRFRISPVPPAPGQWRVEYFSDKHLATRCYEGSESTPYIFKRWEGGAPASGCPSNNFSARFTRNVDFQGGSYSFHLEHDDGARLFIDGQQVIDAWRDGRGSHDGGRSLSGIHEVMIEYFESGDSAHLEAWWHGPDALPEAPPVDPAQWRAEYYANPDWAGAPTMRLNEGSGFLDHAWGYGGPGYELPSDNFSTRFTRTVAFACGRYRFTMTYDDTIGFFIDGLKHYGAGFIGSYAYEVDLSAGNHVLTVEHQERGGVATLQLRWQQLSACAQPPDPPNLVSPANGAVFNRDDPAHQTLSWSSIADAMGYEAEYWTTPVTSIRTSGRLSGTAWRIDAQAEGHTYSWRVRAHNSAGPGPWSEPWQFTVRLHQIGPLQGNAVSCRQIDLVWEAYAWPTSSSGDLVKIYRNGAAVAQVGPNTRAYRDVDLAGSTSYTYRLTAFRGQAPLAESPYSRELTVTTPPCSQPLPPTTPTPATPTPVTPPPAPSVGPGPGPPSGNGATAWFFAEGYTGTGFDTYLTLQNPNSRPASIHITYFLTGAAPIHKEIAVPASSRYTVAMHETSEGVGRGQAVSTKVESANGVGIVVERPMYFTYGGSITGGHNVLGATAPRQAWLFAEGYTGEGFDEYLTIMNPNDSPAPITITYFLTGAGPVVKTMTVPASSRYTVAVHETAEGIGRGQAVSARVETSHAGGIVVERPMYFRYLGSSAGGHDVLGAAETRTVWSFPDGNTTPGYDEYLTIMNPENRAAQVTLTYYTGEGSTTTRNITVPASSRSTVQVHSADAGVGRGLRPAVTVASTNGVGLVVERPLYTPTGGDNVMGAADAKPTWLFAEGYTGAGFEEELVILNPNASDVAVTVTYYLSNGATVEKSLTAPARSRRAVRVNDAGEGIGPGQAVSARVTTSHPGGIVVERAIAFTYLGSIPGSHTVMGYAP